MKKSVIAFSLWLLLLTGCAAPPQPVPLPPGCDLPGTVIRDEIEETERGYAYRFMVYLPPCYEADTGPGYPVIYLVPGLGGGPANWFGAGAQETAEGLILSGEVLPFLLVATETTSNNPDGTDIYRDLLPQVEARYNTLADRQHRAVAGASLGGSAAYRLAFQHPETFASAGLFGSGLVAGENERVAGWLAAAGPENRPRVFLNSGEGDPLMVERAEALAEILDQAGVEVAWIVDEGDHSYAYWASHLAEYFRWAAEDW